VTWQTSPSPNNHVWSVLFDRWRKQLTGRPPSIALLVAAYSGNDSPVGAYPDLNGVDEIVADLTASIKRDKHVRIALNMEAEHIAIQWSLCNRLENILLIGDSRFERDRERIKPSPIRDAWEVLLYNLPDSHAVILDLHVAMPKGFFTAAAHWRYMEKPEILHDPDGRIYCQKTRIPIPNSLYRAALKRLLPLLPQRSREGALNTKVRAWWLEPNTSSRLLVEKGIAARNNGRSETVLHLGFRETAPPATLLVNVAAPNSERLRRLHARRRVTTILASVRAPDRDRLGRLWM
jgi:hypothetical protein